jgi:hypothetical protein
LRRFCSASGFRGGELALHVIENVGDGVFCETFEAGVGGPTEMGVSTALSKALAADDLRNRFLEEYIKGSASDGVFPQ